MSTRARHQPWFLDGVGIELRLHWRFPGSAFCDKHESAHATGYRAYCFACLREEQFGEAYRRWEEQQISKMFSDVGEASA